MKKKLIWCIVLTIILLGIFTIFLIPGLYRTVLDFIKNTAVLKTIHAFLKQHFSEIYSALKTSEIRDGLIAIVSVLLVIFGLLPLLKVDLVNDDTMKPIVVKQKAYGVYYDEKAIAPSMVVVKEEKENGGK